MKTDIDLTKLSRWIVPGWIAILSYYVFVSIDILFAPSSTTAPSQQIAPSITEFVTGMTDINEFILLALFLAAGVPLGFSIYQFYFYIRWNSPFSRDGLLPPLITGRLADNAAVLRGIEPEQIIMKANWRKKWVNSPAYEKDHKHRTNYRRFLFLEIVQKIDSRHRGLSIFERYSYLHEIVHTLSSCAIAIYLGFAAYLYTKFTLTNIPLVDYLFIALFLGIILFVILNVEQEKQAFESEDSESKDKELETHKTPHRYLAWLNRFSSRFRPNLAEAQDREAHIVDSSAIFLFAIFLIHFWANPSIAAASGGWFNGIMKVVVSTLLVGMWVWSKSQSPRYHIKVTVAYLLLSVFLAITISAIRPLVVWIDWPYFTALFAFLVANLTLVKNSHNARQEMYALERYTLQRYLNRGRKPSVLLPGKD